MTGWIETNEQYDVAVSLNEVLRQLDRVASGDVYAWKWAVIALSCAANGALICILSGTMNIGALGDDDVATTIEALQHDSIVQFPKYAKLAPPHTLLKRARRADLRKEQAGSILKLNSSQTREFKKLVRLRNEFIHFAPMGWAIETSGMTSMVERVLTIIEQVIKDDWSFRHQSDDLRTHLIEACQNIHRACGRIDVSN